MDITKQSRNMKKYLPADKGRLRGAKKNGFAEYEIQQNRFTGFAFFV
jgi:hypothetical protein